MDLLAKGIRAANNVKLPMQSSFSCTVIEIYYFGHIFFFPNLAIDLRKPRWTRIQLPHLAAAYHRFVTNEKVKRETGGGKKIVRATAVIIDDRLVIKAECLARYLHVSVLQRFICYSSPYGFQRSIARRIHPRLPDATSPVLTRTEIHDIDRIISVLLYGAHWRKNDI